MGKFRLNPFTGKLDDIGDDGSSGMAAHLSAYNHSLIATALQAEVDTLDSVTTRGNTTANYITVAGLKDAAATPKLSVDANNRKLYCADGTTIRLDWCPTPTFFSGATDLKTLFVDGTTTPYAFSAGFSTIYGLHVRKASKTENISNSSLMYGAYIEAGAFSNAIANSCTLTTVGVQSSAAGGRDHSSSATVFENVRGLVSIASYGIGGAKTVTANNYNLAITGTTANANFPSSHAFSGSGTSSLTVSGIITNVSGASLTRNSGTVTYVAKGLTVSVNGPSCSGTVTSTIYGIHSTVSAGISGTQTYYNLYLDGTVGNNFLGKDNIKSYFGTSLSSSIYYNATNLVINPKEAGSGALSILGNISLVDFDMVLGTTTGTKIGTATSQKLGFWNVTPVVQQATNAYTSDAESSAYTGIDNEQDGSVYAQLADLNTLRTAYDNLRASYDDLLTKLKNTGIVA